MRRVALAAALLFALAIPASAAPVKQYRLKPHAACRVHYIKRRETVKERKHGKVVKVKETFCVYIAPKTKKPTPPVATTPVATTTPTTTGTPTAAMPVLAVHLDPTFVQSPTNPLDVTYTYSAAATINGSPDPSIPAGVLSLYSDGLLACSMNVGGSITGGTCEVIYAAYGAHTVNVIYDAGSNSVTTGNEVESIEPLTPPVLSTTVTLSVGSQDNFSTTPVGATVLDSNGVAVTSGTVSYQLEFYWGGHQGYPPVAPIIGPVGTTCDIIDLVVSEGSYDDYQVSSSNCSGGGTLVASAFGTTPPDSITVQGMYSGATYDHPSTSGVVAYP